MTASHSASVPIPAERPLTAGILVLLAGLAALGTLATNIILPAFPGMSRELSLTSPELGLLLSSFFTAFAGGQLIVGPLSDRFGRRVIVLGGIAIFVLGSIISGVASSLTFLVIGKIVQALGACSASVLSRAIARDLFTGQALGKALSLTMVVGAAAPGFSPLLGSLLSEGLGWRATFFAVGAAGVALAFHYIAGVGETHTESHATRLAPMHIGKAYVTLLKDSRFFFPALAVGLIIGGLYSLFASAPGVLMNELGLTPLQLGLSFASTVTIVFAAGLAAPRLSARIGQRQTGLIGLVIALSGGAAVFWFTAVPTYMTYTLAISLYLLGMGFANPLGTAIALTPFHNQAGLASALLGFMQMSCAAIGSAIVNSLPFAPSVSLAVTLTAGSVIALIAFVPVMTAGQPANSQTSSKQIGG